MTRKLQSMMSAVRQLQGVEFYHPAAQTVKCVFYNYPVELAFHATANEEQYQLEVYVVKGKERMPLSAFKRYHFLVETESCYYQLTSKSHDAIEWLQQQNTSEWTTNDPAAFEQVLNNISIHRIS